MASAFKIVMLCVMQEETMNELKETNVRSTEEVLENLGIPVSAKETRNRLQEHVTVHKYLLDREHGDDVDWGEALASWSTQVAYPLRDALQDKRVKSSFPSKTADELFFEVSDHWHFLKQDDPQATPDEAADAYARSYGNPVTRFLGSSIAAPIARWFVREVERTDRIEKNTQENYPLYDADLR